MKLWTYTCFLLLNYRKLSWKNAKKCHTPSFLLWQLDKTKLQAQYTYYHCLDYQSKWSGSHNLHIIRIVNKLIQLEGIEQQDCKNRKKNDFSWQRLQCILSRRKDRTVGEREEGEISSWLSVKTHAVWRLYLHDLQIAAWSNTIRRRKKGENKCGGFDLFRMLIPSGQIKTEEEEISLRKLVDRKWVGMITFDACLYVGMM